MYNSEHKLFQTLPLDIIHVIIGFLPKDKDYVYNAKYTLALLQCCHRWRNVFIKMTFKSLSFDYLLSVTPRLVFSNCPEFIQPLDYMSFVSTRSVTTSFNMWNSVRHGDFASIISKTGFSKIKFPSVNSVTVSIILNMTTYQQCTTTKKYIVQDVLDYLQLINTMFPAVTDLNLHHFYVDSSCENPLLLPVIFRILDMISKATLVSFTPLIGAKFLVNGIAARFNELTSFTFRFSFGALWFVDVIRQNAKTLVNIKLLDIPIYYPDYFLYQENGSMVVYPCLRSLQFFNHSLPCCPPLNITNYSSDYPVHFPNLKIFTTDTVFPFDFNFMTFIPMTMERLDICLPNTPVDLTKVWPFPFKSVPNLTHLDIRHHKHSAQCNESLLKQRDAFFCQIIKPILRSSDLLNNLKLLYPISKAAFFEHILMTNLLLNIFKLHIPNIQLNISDFVALLKSAQRLQYLECNLDSSALSFKNVGADQLAHYALANYFPLSKNFQKLVIGDGTNPSQLNLAQLISIFALMCPNFTQMNFKRRDSGSTLMLIEEICNSDIFLEYSHILTPFLMRLKSQSKY